MRRRFLSECIKLVIKMKICDDGACVSYIGDFVSGINGSEWMSERKSVCVCMWHTRGYAYIYHYKICTIAREEKNHAKKKARKKFSLEYIEDIIRRGEKIRAISSTESLPPPQKTLFNCTVLGF